MAENLAWGLGAVSREELTEAAGFEPLIFPGFGPFRLVSKVVYYYYYCCYEYPILAIWVWGLIYTLAVEYIPRSDVKIQSHHP